jgi:hypothetical protein
MMSHKKYTLLTGIMLMSCIAFTSCQNGTPDKREGYFIERTFAFPHRVDSILKVRLAEIEKDKNLNGLAISFNNTIDSTRFIIHGVFSNDFLTKYPASFYYKLGEKYIFVYSGLENYSTSTTEIPHDISSRFADLSKDNHAVMVHPEYIEYAYFNLDSSDQKVNATLLEYNRFFQVR